MGTRRHGKPGRSGQAHAPRGSRPVATDLALAPPQRGHVARRTFLRGAGFALALPLLEAGLLDRGRTSLAAGALPPRLAFLYLGTGWNTRELFPKTPGRAHEMTPLLAPLEPHRGDFTVLQGMFLEFGGGHEGDNTFLTGADTSARTGKKNSVSCDQVAARVLGKTTRIPSLELSERRGTGYGAQGLRTLAWSQDGVPLSAECDPKAVFDRLFSADTPEQRRESERRFRQRRSLLDGMRDQARQLEQAVGRADRERLEQYFTSLREVEKQLERDVSWSKDPKPRLAPGVAAAFGVSMHPETANFDYRVYARMMYDLIALAWQTDSTRVVTYVVRRELFSHYPGITSSTDYHNLTHHGGDAKKLDELARIDTIYMQHLAAFLAKLKTINEPDGTLLDRCIVGIGSGMGMGHSRNQLPTLVAGGRKLGLRHRGFVRYDSDTPLANLWSTMLASAGVPGAQQLRGRTGQLRELL
jgi:hypothetical protein